MRYEAEIANIAQDKANYYISIKAEFQMVYFMYSTWQSNTLVF